MLTGIFQLRTMFRPRLRMRRKGRKGRRRQRRKRKRRGRGLGGGQMRRKIGLGGGELRRKRRMITRMEKQVITFHTLTPSLSYYFYLSNVF